MDIERINSRIVELCRLFKGQNSTSFYQEIADIIATEYGVRYSTGHIREISRKFRRDMGLDENFSPIGKPTESYATEDTSSRDISIKRGEKLTEERLLSLHGYDPAKFTIVNAKNSFWTLDGDNERYSSRITVKPKNEFVWTQDLVDKIFEGLKVPVSDIDYKMGQYEENGKALILPIVDLHYAMKVSSEAANDRYNRNVATGRYIHVIEDVISRVKDKKFEHIYFTIGNDLFNCDTKSGTTTKGTPQDNDGDIESAIIEATDLVIRTIDKLKTIAPVDVIHIPSNHDYIISFGIANAIRTYYSNDENVDVDCGFRERKYRKFGNTLMGFAHDLKVSSVNDIITSDARELVSDTLHSVYFLAHLHHEECIDVSGTDVRRLPTISSGSRWTYNNGYNAAKKCQSFIVDERYGITDVLYTHI